MNPVKSSRSGIPFRIVGLNSGHHDEWRSLYKAYAEFYRTSITDEALERTWSWLMDPLHVEKGLGAEPPSGGLLGIAHYRSFPKPMLGCEACFLDDLFVDPAARGSGVGRGLIEAVVAVARGNGWTMVRWITAEDNHTARALYDDLAERTRWVTYEAKP